MKTMDEEFRSLRDSNEMDDYRNEHQVDTDITEDENLIYMWRDGSSTKMRTVWGKKAL